MEFIEVSAKNIDDAITEGLIQLGTTSDQVEYEVIERGSTGFLGLGSKQATIKIRKKATTEDFIREFLSDVFSAMEMDVEVLITKGEDEKDYNVELKGADMGVLIGKRGQTLDSLQYLTNLAVNKKCEEFVRIKLDTEDYRTRRIQTLENLAKNVAYKVKRSRRPVALEPMSPYERRVIHAALQNEKFVTTHSEGEGAFRHVVVTYKK